MRQFIACVTAVMSWSAAASPIDIQAQAAGQVRFELAPTGNEARYRVREQLAGFDFPNDAVGVTTNIKTQAHMTVELAIKDLKGLTLPLARSGELKFELIGDLTVKGVTKPTTWAVTASPRDGGLARTAGTKFTFADFNLTKPRVASVLSVNDDITLESDFHLIPKPAGRPGS